MRLVLVALVLSACGGGGKCENPPCQIPQASCDSDEDCFESELCDFERNSCGAISSDQGTCVRRPTSCTGDVELVCGCDGQMHSNPCVAASKGADINNAGGCPLPANAFACGARACDRTSQVCFDSLTGADSHFFQCDTFPDMCRLNRTCECLAQFGCGNCSETGGGFTLQCMLSPNPNEDL